MNNFKKFMGIFICFIVVSLGIVIFIQSTQVKPKEVFEQFSNDKDIAIGQYNKLSSTKKGEVQTLIKNQINSIYETKDDSKLLNEVLWYINVRELDSYINEMKDKVKYRKIYMDVQKRIEDAKGVGNMKDYELMSVLDEYCSIPKTYEKYDEVLDNIISLKDKYYKRFYRTLESKKK